MSIEGSLAPSRRTSCSRDWLASLGRNSGVIAYRPWDSLVQRAAVSSIVPPGWIATKKVSLVGPDSEPPQAARPTATSDRRRPGRPGPCGPAGCQVLFSIPAPRAEATTVRSRGAPRKGFLNRQAAAGQQAVERLPEPGDGRVERGVVAGGAGAQQGALDGGDDEAGEGLGLGAADAFVAQRRGDRPFPALEGGGGDGGELGVLGPGEGGGGDRAAEPLRVVGDAAAEDRRRTSSASPSARAPPASARSGRGSSSPPARPPRGPAGSCRRGSGGRSSRAGRGRARPRRAAPSRRSPSRPAAGGRR